MKRKTRKNYGYFIAMAGCAALLLCGCGQKQRARGESATPVPGGSQGEQGIFVQESSRGDAKKEGGLQNLPEESSLLLPAKHNTVLAPGSTAKGIFDDSRESISVLCMEKDGEQVLYVDGVEALRTAKNDTVLLYDIDTDDAFLELVVAKEFSGTGSVSEKRRRINAYRVHPGELAEIAVFPLREDNSFLISDWRELSFRNGVVQLGWQEDVGKYSGEYRLMPQGFLAKQEQPLTPIRIDGELLLLPSGQVAISADYPLAVAWVEVERPGDNWTPNTANYDIYRSTDGGVTWSLAVAGFLKEVADFDAIYILDESTVVTCFGISGVTGQRRAELSEDGGRTWHSADKKEYWFFYQGGEDPAKEFGSSDTKKKEGGTRGGEPTQTASVAAEPAQAAAEPAQTASTAFSAPAAADGAQTVLPAKSGVVLAPGSMARGMFDDSRKNIHVLCQEEDGKQVICVDGKRALEVGKDKKIMLFDMGEQDAFLELLVMEEFFDEKETDTSELSKKWRINAYRVHPGELAEVEILSTQKENSFVAEEWNFAFPNNRISVCNLGEASGDYRITPLGLLVREGHNVVPVVIDGEVHEIPSDQVAVYKDHDLAIAFEEQYGLMNQAHYNVYHSTDGGRTWSLAAEDFTIAYAPFDHIYIVDDSTVLLCLGLSGVTGVREGFVSTDGGCTWEFMDLETYGFLGIHDPEKPLWQGEIFNE